jgi:hypothetical protein
MAGPSQAQLREYLQAHPLSGFAGPLEIVPLSGPEDEQRYLLSAGEKRAVLKRYAPAGAERARREATGLTLGGTVGLAPTLLLADLGSNILGGPVVAFTPPPGAPLGGRPLAEDEVQGWLFLLLALHHLPPAQLTIPSGMSADIVAWWQRMQPAWQACRTAYSGKPTRPLLDSLTKLHAIVGARVEARKALWKDVPRRPCHGNAVAEHVVRDGVRFALVEWGDFGLGDPALEIGRAAGLALLTGELSGQQHAQLVGSYLRGAGDFGDKSLAERILLFNSVLPLGFSFTLLQLLAHPLTPAADRARDLEQVARALAMTAEALQIGIGDPHAMLAPLRGTA